MADPKTSIGISHTGTSSNDSSHIIKKKRILEEAQNGMNVFDPNARLTGGNASIWNYEEDRAAACRS